MRILLATAHPYIPQIAGGAQTSTHELACAFRERGHEVGVVCGLNASGLLAYRNRALMKLLRRRVMSDHSLGYPVYRSWFAWETLADVVESFKPDVLFAQSGLPARMGKAGQQLGLPVVVYLHNVEEDDFGGSFRDLAGVRYIANSHFTSRTFSVLHGLKSTVIHPLVDRSRYKTPLRCRNVTFVNPHPHKGSALALEIARQCSEIPFLFSECWTLGAEMRRDLMQKLADLPNVTLKPRTQHMKNIYRDTRVLLVPSRWEEAFGRVVAEAHFSGIPVVASNRGGLPESVGPGGVLLDPEGPVQEWSDAIRRLWNDEAYWTRMSQAAIAHADRPELNCNEQVDAVFSVLEAVAGKSSQHQQTIQQRQNALA
ncbi:glycosyltransferase [Hyphomicrobium sp. NDB2Meth4]|uniref:glycosyltransferase n=1 Tax=Hyphomicrobium sp. NDB2Meth4 TaxID=1892846 RepID=UPI000930ACC5|nr:glycosyltransferase [Hyphomicrobium sp. NDB2Meth4]